MTKFIQIDPVTGKIFQQLDVPESELEFYTEQGRVFIPWNRSIQDFKNSTAVQVGGEWQITVSVPPITVDDVRDMRNRRLQGVIARLDADTKRQELGLPSAMTPAKRAEWLTYYQALCDVPQNFVPGADLVWPTPPSE